MFIKAKRDEYTDGLDNGNCALINVDEIKYFFVEQDPGQKEAIFVYTKDGGRFFVGYNNIDAIEGTTFEWLEKTMFNAGVNIIVCHFE